MISMSPLKIIGLGLGFIFELVAFAAFASLGWLFPANQALHIMSFIILLGALITFWSIYMAPRALKKFSPVPYYGAKLIVYGLSAIVVYQLFNPTLGVLFMGATIIDEALLFRHNLS